MKDTAIAELYQVRKDLGFSYSENLENKRDSTWRLDQITAYLNAGEVGHIKISYIPSARFDQNYPGILNWLSQIKGEHVLPCEYRRTPWRDIPIDALRTCIFTMAQAANIGWASSCRLNEIAKTASDDTLIEMLSHLEELLKERHEFSFRQFRSFHVDKPLVDFIYVDKFFRRQGIGTALYRAGFRWMHARGLPFYSSDCQSDLAKLAWQSMRTRFEIEEVQEPGNSSERTGRPRLRFVA